MSEPGSAPSVAVVDIDGVVADVAHRLHHLHGAKNWPRFFAAAAHDPLLRIGADVVRELSVAYGIVWLSGRPESLREATERWLAAYELPAGRLLLRRPGDYRPAAVTKLESVRELARTATIAAVVDDDPDVVDALTAAGFPTVLADWVPHEKTLRDAQQRDGRT